MKYEDYEKLVADIIDPDKAENRAQTAQQILEGLKADDTARTQLAEKLKAKDAAIDKLNQKIFLSETGKPEEKKEPEKTPEEIFADGWHKLFDKKGEEKK